MNNTTGVNPISFIVPGRNNLKYFKWSYESIRTNLGYAHEICFADDNSNDGTWEYVTELSKTDVNLKIIKNTNGFRIGHTILYDKLINEVATNEIVMIWHCDMYATPDLISNMQKYLTKGTIVTATRVEPPLHPKGVEKIIQDFGTEPENFDSKEFDEWYNTNLHILKNKVTHGIFAPFMFYKDDFISINGHDSLFCVQSKEDSDLFNRMLLAKYKFIQSWDALVYHMTSRGSRFNPTLTSVGTNSDEWNKQNIKSYRNYIRKWGTLVKHDEYLYPIIIPRYKINLVLYNLKNIALLHDLEPFSDSIYIEMNDNILSYIESENQMTIYDLNTKFNRIELYNNNNYTKSDIFVIIDCNRLTDDDIMYLTNIREIISKNAEIGEFELDNLEVIIHSLDTYENDLIMNRNSYKDHQYINYNLK